jgi:hypothetical protein
MTQKLDLPMNDLISELFNHHEPNDVRRALLIIDDFIINTLKIDEKRLPWRHETNEEESFIELISLIRMSLVRVFSEYEKRHFKKIKH